MALKPLSVDKRALNQRWIQVRFQELGDERFYGTVEVSVQNGIPVHLRIVTTEKPPDNDQVVGNTKPRS